MAANYQDTWFEILTLVLVKTEVLWGVTLCHRASSSWHYEGS